MECRKGVPLAPPLEGLVVTPNGLETLVDGRPQGLQPIPLFDTVESAEALRSEVDAQLTALYENARRLTPQYFAPKNQLAAILMRVPDEM